MGSYLGLLNNFIAKEHAQILEKIRELTSCGEITYELLWGLIIPRTVIFMTCPTTSEPRAARVQSMRLIHQMDGSSFWRLACEYIDVNDDSDSDKDHPQDQFGLADISLTISSFSGIMKICDLSVFPVDRHPQRDAVKRLLIERGRKWVAYNGKYHIQYNGLGYRNGTAYQVLLILFPFLSTFIN